jgi:hypothetical protein
VPFDIKFITGTKFTSALQILATLQCKVVGLGMLKGFDKRIIKNDVPAAGIVHCRMRLGVYQVRIMKKTISVYVNRHLLGETVNNNGIVQYVR